MIHETLAQTIIVTKSKTSFFFSFSRPNMLIDALRGSSTGPRIFYFYVELVRSRNGMLLIVLPLVFMKAFILPLRHFSCIYTSSSEPSLEFINHGCSTFYFFSEYINETFLLICIYIDLFIHISCSK
jgi:hypothetical protein